MGRFAAREYKEGIMFNPNEHTSKTQSIFMQSVEMLANLSAFVAAFFVSLEVYVRTVAFVIDYTTKRYGHGFEDIVSLTWFGIVTLFVLFGARDDRNSHYRRRPDRCYAFLSDRRNLNEETTRCHVRLITSRTGF
ncbi:MAG: hypothetical protein AAGG79_08140 [Pseudomonadota bacterium]